MSHTLHLLSLRVGGVAASPVSGRSGRRGVRALCAWLLWCGVLAPAAADTRLLVDSGAATLSVLQDGQAVLVLDDIAIGRYGSTAHKRRGDGRTPVGSYRVVGIKPHDSFHYFIALDYPSVADAARGLRTGLISRQQQAAIERAHRQGELPPQHTRLGGLIGIHGIGQGDPQIHARFNWTQGCVAVTDEQLDQLLPWLTEGMAVEIR